MKKPVLTMYNDRFDHPFISIPLRPNAFKLCREFANKVYDTNKEHYALRGQENKNQIIRQNIEGKLGECAVYKYLKFMEYDAKYPDFDIYEASKKSFSADITAVRKEVYSIHVKGQGMKSFKLFSHSYLLQKEDPLCHGINNHFLALTVIESEYRVRLYGFLPSKHLPHVLTCPKKKTLSESKYALYYDDIIDDDTSGILFLLD